MIKGDKKGRGEGEGGSQMKKKNNLGWFLEVVNDRIP
jgi:hypothetical protein